MIQQLKQEPLCSAGLLITGFSPGAYALSIVAEGPAASALFTIVDRNVETTASVDSGFSLGRRN